MHICKELAETCPTLPHFVENAHERHLNRGACLDFLMPHACPTMPHGRSGLTSAHRGQNHPHTFALRSHRAKRIV
jgi:hypothetical protein